VLKTFFDKKRSVQRIHNFGSAEGSGVKKSEVSCQGEHRRIVGGGMHSPTNERKILVEPSQLLVFGTFTLKVQENVKSKFTLATLA
jgi:hypothetical protein